MSSPLGTFGFSLTGALFLLALVLPNIIWAVVAKPKGYGQHRENRVFQFLERVGQALTAATAVLFTDTNPGPWSPWSWWFVGALVLLAAYEGCWIRYFTSRRTMQDFNRSLLGLPVPLAILPVGAFLLLGIYGRLVPLIVAAIVLGIGHIGVSLDNARSAEKAEA